MCATHSIVPILTFNIQLNWKSIGCYYCMWIFFSLLFVCRVLSCSFTMRFILVRVHKLLSGSFFHYYYFCVLFIPILLLQTATRKHGVAGWDKTYAAKSRRRSRKKATAQQQSCTDEIHEADPNVIYLRVQIHNRK